MKLFRALVLLAVLTACGCIRSTQTLTIKKDGAGLLDVDYSIAEQTISQLKTMLKVQGDLASAMNAAPTVAENGYTRVFLDPVEDVLRRELARYEKYGVTVDQLQVIHRNARRNVRMKLRFRNIAELAKTDIFADCGFSLVRRSDGNYLLYRDARPRSSEEGVDFSDPQTVRLLGPLLAGFNVSIAVNTPGRIIESNAPSKGPFTAGWEFDFDRDAAALQNLQTKSMIVLFEGAGLTLPAIKQSQ